jgi:hypothetical protein
MCVVAVALNELLTAGIRVITISQVERKETFYYYIQFVSKKSPHFRSGKSFRRLNKI